jgi:hypothetical protein
LPKPTTPRENGPRIGRRETPVSPAGFAVRNRGLPVRCRARNFGGGA